MYIHVYICVYVCVYIGVDIYIHVYAYIFMSKNCYTLQHTAPPYTTLQHLAAHRRFLKVMSSLLAAAAVG